MGSDARGGITQGGVSPNFSYAPKTNMANKPVNFVSWYDSIRFANWLHNGQGGGDTEAGAYTLVGGTPVPSNSLSITRNADAAWFLPTEDEWYKAAYYDSTGSSYFDYPTASNTAPTTVVPPGGINSANYGFGVGAQTDVGAYTTSVCPYGTFDQGGNVWEWNEALISGSYRSLRGGSVGGDSSDLLASNRYISLVPTGESGDFGFRVATVPEPSSFVLAALGFVGLAAWGWRRKT